MLLSSDSGPIPIVIGSTGHRDIPIGSIAALRSEVERILRSILSEYPHTSVQLYTSLADGSDRLVAQVAMALGMRLVVPLPLSLNLYTADFDDDSRSEFDELCRRAHRVFVIPGAAAASDRASAYARLGAFLARSCHILIALWNGRRSHKTGGTSDVVRFKLDGVPEEYQPENSALLAVNNGPVYQVVTPRQGDGAVLPDAAYTTIVHYPPSHGPKEAAKRVFDRVFERTDAFNADALRLAKRLSSKLAASRHTLIGAIPEAHLDEQMLASLRLYQHADALAEHFHSRTSFFLRAMYLLALVAVLAFELYSHGVWLGPHATIAYVVSLLAAFTLGAWARHARYQDKHLDDRALAEGLRVRFYWSLAGLEDSSADYYMRKQRDELDWIRAALRSGAPEPVLTTPAPALSDDERLRSVLLYWIEPQGAYFAKCVRELREEHKARERDVRLLVVVGLATAALLSLVLVLAPYNAWSAAAEHWLKRDHLHHAVVLLAIGLPAAGAALLHSYMEKRAVASNMKRYTRIQAMFAEAQRQLRTAIRDRATSRGRAIIRELGRDALDENGDWVIMHRERPLEVPHPG